MQKFKAKIQIIGVNPYVLLPARVLKEIFKQAGKDKGKIPVKMKIDGHAFTQTLVKYSARWRLYLNTPMRKAAGKAVGDYAAFEIEFDPVKREIKMHPGLEAALKKDKEAKNTFDSLSPSRKLEIVRYISFLKKEETINKNITRVINFLNRKERFVGRDSP